MLNSGRLGVALGALVLIVGRDCLASPAACESAGFHVGYFNGATTSKTEARSELRLLQDKLGAGGAVAATPITFELYYNTTGGRVRDFAELFQQRFAEGDGILRGRVELLWGFLSFAEPQTLIRSLVDVVPELLGLTESLEDDLLTEEIDRVARLVTSAPNELESESQRARLDEHVAAGQKVVLVGYSQGSLFANLAYDHVAASGGTVQAIHIAPASGEPIGSYVLADLDLVIRGLGAVTKVPEPNVNIPLSRAGASSLFGHHLANVYLDESLQPVNLVRQQFSEATSIPPEPVCDESPPCFSLALGDYHSCARRTDGSLWCWGAGGFGQLGNGESANIAEPTAVIGLGADVAAVGAGSFHTCAVRVDGSLWCWGMNLFGQLGDGSTTSRTVPGLVSGFGTPVQRVALGARFSCALDINGSVWCWGSNFSGELGQGTVGGTSALPLRVAALPGDIVEVSTGVDFACATTDTGALWCWGNNGNGQLGRVESGVSSMPALATTISAVGDVALGGDFGLVHNDSGTLWSWGGNAYGQAGDGTIGGSSSTLTPIVGLEADVERSAAGWYHACAITASDGSLWCWGHNLFGELGDGTVGGLVPLPEQIIVEDRAVQVAAGQGHTCATLGNQSVWCWGKSDAGQLGDGTTGGEPCGASNLCRSLPVRVALACE